MDRSLARAGRVSSNSGGCLEGVYARPHWLYHVERFGVRVCHYSYYAARTYTRALDRRPNIVGLATFPVGGRGSLAALSAS
jgi:hypothetical protein